MRCLWLQDQKLEFRTDIPTPVPAEGEALIRVRLAGVCSTDLELMRGYYPFNGIPGHEFVGEVVNSPTDPSWVSKRVVGEINIACGSCEMCQNGLPRHCEKRKTLGIHSWNGAFAEYLVLPQGNLHEVPAQVTDEQAVFTEPLAAAYEIIEQVQIIRGDKVLVLGAGRLGQLVAQVLQSTGCDLQVLARNPRPAQLLAARKIGTVSQADLRGMKYDVVVEATGSPDGFHLARQSVRPRGTIVLKSTYRGEVQVDISSVVVDEITLVGSRCGPFEPALDLLKSHQVDAGPLIDAIYPLEQGIMAFEHAARPGALKILSRPG